MLCSWSHQAHVHCSWLAAGNSHVLWSVEVHPATFSPGKRPMSAEARLLICTTHFLRGLFTTASEPSLLLRCICRASVWDGRNIARTHTGGRWLDPWITTGVRLVKAIDRRAWVCTRNRRVRLQHTQSTMFIRFWQPTAPLRLEDKPTTPQCRPGFLRHHIHVPALALTPVVHEIRCSQDLITPACCDLDLWPPETNQVISRATVYSPSVLSKLFRPYMRYRGNNIWLNETTGQPKTSFFHEHRWVVKAWNHTITKTHMH